MIPRMLGRALQKAVRSFPAVVVTGPRQSGKTTLVRHLLSTTHRYVSLENPDVRVRAQEDPLGFLEAHRPPTILDEIQYVPELLPYLKTQIDERRRPGQWILTGSQNFVLMQGVSESLAGRAAVLSLLPFSFAERIKRGAQAKSVPEWLKALSLRPRGPIRVTLPEALLRGGYPGLASRPSVDRQLWCGAYVATYLERDVRNLAQIGDLSQFERFVRLCATRTGQLLNLSGMANEIGVSVPTAKRWLSILETSYQVYLLYPYYRNLGKRLVKSPKLYFNDTALASYLLGLHDRETVLNSPSLGALFETFVVTDCLKRFLHAGQMPSMYYLRTRDGVEVDLVIEVGQKLHFFEIKHTMTVLPKHAAAATRLANDLRPSVAKVALISCVPTSLRLTRTVDAYSWKQALGH